MSECLKKVILKYTGISVENGNQNLLDLPVYAEVWLYIITELEEKYKLPMLQVIEEITPDEFDFQTICRKLETYCRTM